MTRNTCIASLVVVACGFVAAARAGDATVPGEVTTPYPTLINLGVEWQIEGDDNENGRVDVRFRAVGETDWHAAMPLRRVPGGQSRPPSTLHKWKNRHAGSIFDLKPDTEYEIHLKLVDPDGGDAERTVRARTRPVPRIAPGAEKRVNPQSFAAAAAEAKPGDILILEAGHYGALTMPRDGAPGKRIVIQGSDGAVCESVSLRGRKHVHLEGITVKQTKQVYAGVDLISAEDCVVRRCHIEAVYGVRATRPPGATNCYVADNVIKGITPWTSEAMGADGKNEGEGVEMTGPGNVICFNRVSNFRDCISTMESQNAFNQVCIDIYNNDIEFGADDGVEADYAMGNCRIMRNRLTNCFVGLSSQPGLGGPTYFIRNVMYNLTYVPYKLHNGSQGDVVLHNTVVKTGDAAVCFTPASWGHALFRNNIAIGGRGGPWTHYSNGTGLAANFPAADATCDFDYDGYGTVDTPFAGRIGGKRFDSLAALRANTTEKHAVQLGLDIFAAKVQFPDPGTNKWPAPDLRLKPDSPAIDAGVVLPNLNDGYTGKAPDLGAYEYGQDPPHYGPRPPGVDEATPPKKRDS
ncbi:MAG TPA: right-handed parallel beta-helix repeat-containing protein [Gemmataceae bacterium]|nr:right-handed parallel beta-helix repeat-containing protein [Gemmataceae bacterium]